MLKNVMYGNKVTKMWIFVWSPTCLHSETDRKTDGEYDGNQKTDDSTNYRGLQTMSSAGEEHKIMIHLSYSRACIQNKLYIPQLYFKSQLFYYSTS